MSIISKIIEKKQKKARIKEIKHEFISREVRFRFNFANIKKGDRVEFADKCNAKLFKNDEIIVDSELLTRVSQLPVSVINKIYVKLKNAKGFPLGYANIADLRIKDISQAKYNTIMTDAQDVQQSEQSFKTC